jgi:hypothetical protein
VERVRLPQDDLRPRHTPRNPRQPRPLRKTVGEPSALEEREALPSDTAATPPPADMYSRSVNAGGCAVRLPSRLERLDRGSTQVAHRNAVPAPSVPRSAIVPASRAGVSPRCSPLVSNAVRRVRRWCYSHPCATYGAACGSEGWGRTA